MCVYLSINMSHPRKDASQVFIVRVDYKSREKCHHAPKMSAVPRSDETSGFMSSLIDSSLQHVGLEPNVPLATTGGKALTALVNGSS